MSSTLATNAQWGYTWTGSGLTASLAYNKNLLQVKTQLHTGVFHMMLKVWMV